MFRHIFLTLLLVIANGNLGSTQNGTTVGPTTVAPTAGPATANVTTPAAANTTTTATPAPTTANTTTHAPTHAPTTANATTHAPVPQNTTTPAPTPQNTTTPVPPLPNPEIGNYTLRAQANASACLMAKMGLQVSYKQGTDTQSVNLNPKGTNVSGSCGSNGTDSILILDSDTINMVFVFANETNRFHLRSLNVTVTTSTGGKFSDGNASLSLWDASVGSSYMCRKEQTYEITGALTLHTFDLQVQPFAVEDSKFSTAHECAMDDSSILIPIIVGAALAGLILIVVIAYMIGRRKTYVGYQTL